jgi:molecular chaperone HtpG
MVAYEEAYQFQAETSQLLDLVIHSLYTNKEIFLRELISNASDALDRLRFEALTDPELLAGDDRYEIRLLPDTAARTLSISDSGIGMSRQEVIDNIGTIAKSGTRELREAFKEDASRQVVGELIGQFGVGFYSAFMVADKVTLVTRRADEPTATMWESTGQGSYTLADAQRESRGTTITLHLKPVDADEGIADFTDQWTLSRIVRRYSDFVSYPIICKFQSDQDGEPGAATEVVIEDKTLNSMRPIWARSQAEITEGEYADFYRHITNDWTEPLKTITLKAEGTAEYQALLFIPSKAPHELFYYATESELRLYAKRVLIVERCDELLPKYLRFIKGVVDSADLPLNISRQMLQQDRHIAQMRKWLTRKVLDTLEGMNEKDPDKYLQFWGQFGRALKEGVSSDHENKDRLLRLMLFSSSNDELKLTTLKEYVERMKPEQGDIYYLTGESRSVVENSPHLEGFRERGYEVLYLTDPVDELLVQSVWEYESKMLKSVGKGEVRLGSEQERELVEQELKKKREAATEMLEAVQKGVEEHVKQVRLTSRLVSSPACLVGTEMDYSPQLERLLQKGKGGGAKQRRILELNPEHEVFKKMYERHKGNKDETEVSRYAELLLGYALLAEGSELPDPVRFNQLVIDLMVRTLQDPLPVADQSVS